MSRRARWIAAASAATVVGAMAVPASAQEVTGYRITITNLTDGQPITPPVVALHTTAGRVFDTGATASNGLTQIAENGDNAPLLAALDGQTGIQSFGQAGDGPIVPAERPAGAELPDHVSITLPANGATHLSLVGMLVCTNDGFAGIDSLTLPTTPGRVVTVTGNGYDAGTETNTEDFADIVPPCQGAIGISSADAGTATSNPTLAEGGVITLHGGIDGGVDLVPAVHDWQGPVIEVSVQALTGERETARLAGTNRFDTAIAISQAAFPGGAEVVYLANGGTLVDAVAGGALTDGPVLLVSTCSVPDGVAAEIERLSPGHVVALGGSAAICDEVLAELAQ